MALGRHADIVPPLLGEEAAPQPAASIASPQTVHDATPMALDATAAGFDHETPLPNHAAVHTHTAALPSGNAPLPGAQISPQQAMFQLMTTLKAMGTDPNALKGIKGPKFQRRRPGLTPAQQTVGWGRQANTWLEENKFNWRDDAMTKGWNVVHDIAQKFPELLADINRRNGNRIAPALHLNQAAPQPEARRVAELNMEHAQATPQPEPDHVHAPSISRPVVKPVVHKAMQVAESVATAFIPSF